LTQFAKLVEEDVAKEKEKEIEEEEEEEDDDDDEAGVARRKEAEEKVGLESSSSRNNPKKDKSKKKIRAAENQLRRIQTGSGEEEEGEDGALFLMHLLHHMDHEFMPMNSRLCDHIEIIGGPWANSSSPPSLLVRFCQIMNSLWKICN